MNEEYTARDYELAEIFQKNLTLESVGIRASYFSGYFASGIDKSGCKIYVSCQPNMDDVDLVKEQLKHFLESQPYENEQPIIA